MAIICLPQPAYNNLNATGRRLSAARLKCATTSGKIKESSKVPIRVRLFRLLPKIIAESSLTGSNRGVSETMFPNAVAESALGR
jgi:hypothetical protein